MFTKFLFDRQKRQQQELNKLEAQEADLRPDKKPPNAYLLFCRDKREEITKSNPEMNAMDKSQMLSSMWKELSDEQKDVYKQRASELMAKFRKENPNFKYKQKKEKKNNKGMTEIGEVDLYQMLNRWFQKNPLLLQQMLSEKEQQGKPNVYKLFFPD